MLGDRHAKQAEVISVVVCLSEHLLYKVIVIVEYHVKIRTSHLYLSPRGKGKGYMYRPSPERTRQMSYIIPEQLSYDSTYH